MLLGPRMAEAGPGSGHGCWIQELSSLWAFDSAGAYLPGEVVGLGAGRFALKAELGAKPPEVSPPWGGPQLSLWGAGAWWFLVDSRGAVQTRREAHSSGPGGLHGQGWLSQPQQGPWPSLGHLPTAQVGSGGVGGGSDRAGSRAPVGHWHSPLDVTGRRGGCARSSEVKPLSSDIYH